MKKAAYYDRRVGLLCRPVQSYTTAAPGAPSEPAGASMGDRTMPPPRGPVNPRKKFAVKPGFSMLDWNLLKTRAKNLAGRDEEGMRGITKAEVRKHNSQHDCWSIFRGKVYNLTPFLHYHPGGVPEIMKGAGRDCTALFDKYHPWVNFDTLVGNLYIGPLITEKKLLKAQQASEEANAADEAKNVDEGEKADVAEDTGEGGGKERDAKDVVVAIEGIALAGRAELDREDSAGGV